MTDRPTRDVSPIVGPIDATVRVPGSKSIANRVLAIAALADGLSRVGNLPDGDDTAAMIDGVRHLGVTVDHADDVAAIRGSSERWPSTDGQVFAGLAGTTSRFMTALAALGSQPITIDGHPPLRARPFAPLHDALTALGVEVVAVDGRRGSLPAVITGPPASGAVRIPGDVSSQYITALMLIGPYLPGGLDLEMTTELVSRPYVELTAAAMSWFGHDGVDITDDRVRVQAGAYTTADVDVEPDASSASYPLAVAAICGGSVSLPGLGSSSLQGDAVFGNVLAAMGCHVTIDDTTTRVTGADELTGIDIDMADISDLVPTLAVVAACATTPTRIRGVGFIREKESDRLGDLASELRSVGVDIDETADGLDIRPSASTLHGGVLGTHHDHRLAMAFGVLGSRVDGVRVSEPGVVSKSWPTFWSMLEALSEPGSHA